MCDKDNGGCGENEQCELNGAGEVLCTCEEGMIEEEGACVRKYTNMPSAMINLFHIEWNQASQLKMPCLSRVVPTT